MKLTFKMKVKLSLLVGFAFIIALIIHEDHAGVVLKKFKPRRVLSAESKSKVDSEVSSKTASKHPIKDKVKKKTTTEKNEEVELNKNSTGLNNDTVVTTETISQGMLLNSSVIYAAAKDASSNYNTSKLSRSLPTENSVNTNNCTKPGLTISEKDRNWNCSTSLLATTSNISAEISETKENSSTAHFQVLDSVVQDLSTDKKSNISVSNGASSSNSIVSQQEKNLFETVPDNQTTDLQTEKIQINTALKQQSKRNSEAVNLQQNVSSHLNLSNVNLQDLEIISNESSSVQLVNEMEILRNKDDNGGSENKVTNEILLNQTGHESISANLDFSAHSEVAKKGSTIKQVVNESELSQEKNDSSGSQNISAKETLPNQTGPESIAGLDFLTLSDVTKNDSPTTQLVNESETLQKDGSSIFENISANETLDQTGLESIVSAGLDFLAQSEVAKNVAGAIEIFNLSDSSLTDHIIDDSVIDLVLPSLPIENELGMEAVSSEKEDTKNELIPSNKINESNVNTDIPESDIVLLPVVKKKCPNPGICVFWFMARDACTDDRQCLDSKICCRVRCSKKCIDV